MSGEHRRRDGLRRYSFTYAPIEGGFTNSFLCEREDWAMELCRKIEIFQDLQDGKIVSFEWAKYLRS